MQASIAYCCLAGFKIKANAYVSLLGGILIKIGRRWLIAASKTLIVGIGENAERIENTLKKYKVESYKIVGFVEKEERIEENRDYANKFHILGCLENLRGVVLKSTVADNKYI